MAMAAALTRTRTGPKRPAQAAGSPDAKRVRFSNKMTLEAVIKDLIETFIKRGKLLSSYGNPETNDMGTHMADLTQKIQYNGRWRVLSMA